jgi:hypothetical protein
MMVRQPFQENHWRYNACKRYPEDYELWVTIAEHHELANIPKIYLDYRVWPNSVSQNLWHRWRDQFIDIQSRLLARMGMVPNTSQRKIHESLAFDEIPPNAQFIAAAHAWLLLIDDHNRKTSALNERGLTRVLTGRYIALYRAAARDNLKVAGLADSPFRQYVEIPL